MGRDLLYKPPVPLVLPEETPEGKKAGVPVKGTDKLGLPTRARDLGGSKDEAAKTPNSAKPEKDTNQSKDASAALPDKAGPAFKAAYFNKDVEATAYVNQRASQMQALRGAEGITDLRRIVLPEAAIRSPDPATLRAASDRMNLQGQPELTDILGRQGSFARSQGMTAERLLERMEALQAMVEARVQALARMRQFPANRLARSSTLTQASQAQGAAMEHINDLQAEGNRLIDEANQGAEGMHRRVAKTLGIKRKT